MQVVLGRSTPYFVPSGERAKGPLPNQNATPEHVLETQEVTIYFHSILHFKLLMIAIIFPIFL